MNLKTSLASAATLAVGLSAIAPTGASADSTLLSGYGAPGAGEQAIIGSALLNGPRGRSGGGGSGAGGANTGADGRALTGSSNPPGSGASNGGGGSSAGRAGGSAASSARAYAYPSSLRSARSGSSVAGLTGSDVLLMLAITAGLAALGVVTARVARLQR